MLFGSTPSFIKCYQDVFLNHTHSPHAAIHLKRKEKTDWRLPCERERMPGSFCRLSGSPNGLATSPSPLWGLLGSINTMRTRHWLPKLGRAGDCSISTSGRHYAVAARGWNAWDPMTRERLRVFTKLCVLCREGLNYIVWWVLEYETVTSWEILRVERGWYWEVKTKMMGDSEIQCSLSTWRVSMVAHA